MNHDPFEELCDACSRMIGDVDCHLGRDDEIYHPECCPVCNTRGDQKMTDEKTRDEHDLLIVIRELRAATSALTEIEARIQALSEERHLLDQKLAAARARRAMAWCNIDHQVS